MMKKAPTTTIAIVGRPNVGKSTLFNRLIGFHKAIVMDHPGTTRDRNYGSGEWNGRKFFLIDTGGFEPTANDELLIQMRQQTTIAIEEADIVIFLMDCRDSLLSTDKEIAKLLRMVAKPTFFVVNKVDGERWENLVAEFYQLGVEELFPISALQGYGIADLLDAVTKGIVPHEDDAVEVDDFVTTDSGSDEIIDAEVDPAPATPPTIRLAFVGKPNVGKSSLINKILGHERLIVNAQAGTTRDAIDTEVTVEGKRYLLIDTAGVRRKSRLSLTLEKYSVLQAISAMRRCDIAVLMISAIEGVTEQDTKIAGIIAEAGRGCIIAINKWDAIEKDEKTLGVFVRQVRDALKFMEYAPLVFISATSGQRVGKIFEAAQLVYDEYGKRMSTAFLNEVGKTFLTQKTPQRYRGIENSFFYMTQVSVRPPTFVFFVREPQEIHFSYERYIINRIREHFGFANSPIRVIFRKRGEKPAERKR